MNWDRRIFHSGTMWINTESSGFVLLDSVLAGGPEGQKPKQQRIQAAVSGAGKYKFILHAKIILKGPCLSWPPWSFWKFDVMDCDTQWLVRLVTPFHLINQEKWRSLRNSIVNCRWQTEIGLRSRKIILAQIIKNYLSQITSPWAFPLRNTRHQNTRSRSLLLHRITLWSLERCRWCQWCSFSLPLHSYKKIPTKTFTSVPVL